MRKAYFNRQRKAVFGTPLLLLNFCVLLGCFIALHSATAALLSYEGFVYPSGSRIVGQSGGTGFGTNVWLLNNSGFTISTNQPLSLSYRDSAGNMLVTSGGSLFLQGTNLDVANSTASQPSRILGYARGTNAGATDNVTNWVSFVAVRQGPITNASSLNPTGNPYPRAANISLFNTSSEKLGIGNTTPVNGGISNVVSLLPQGNTNRASTVPFSQTNFIVVRIEHIANALDNVYLFVNPPLGTEPSVSDAATNTLGEYDFSFNRIRPFAGGDRSTSAGSPYAELVVDEIRIGETFADVAPFLPSLQIARSGNNVVLTWSGTNQLQSSGNVVGAYTNLTGATSPYTNTISNSSLFFRLFN